MNKAEWTTKGASLSDKSARKEFGLTQNEIEIAIRRGKLKYQQNNMHGNPYFKLLRAEVEALVIEMHGKHYLEVRLLQNELDQINRDIRKTKRQLTTLEKKKLQLTETLENILAS